MNQLTKEQKERLSKLRDRKQQALTAAIADRRERCSGCGQEVDPDVCGCGQSINHGYDYDNHLVVPMGCICYRDKEVSLTSVSATAKEIVGVVNKTAISLAICRHGLIREAEDDETVLSDEVEDKIIQDVLDCLTGEETGCLDAEELDAENCALLMVQDRLKSAATLMRDKCVEKVKAMRNENNRNYEYWKSIASDPNHDFGVLKFVAWAGEDERVIAALESLTLDTVE